MELSDLRQNKVIENLRKMGCKKVDIDRLHFITEFANLQGGLIRTDWIPTREFAWTISMPFEEIEGGVRRSISGWGETLPEAINGAYERIRSGKIIGPNTMSDKRRWYWSDALQRFLVA